MNTPRPLALATAAVLGAAAAAQGDPGLSAPVRLEADGKVIDMLPDIGHAGPKVRDCDGDGLPDLLVSNFRGSIRFFRNVGERTAPRFAEGEPLQAGGKPIRIHNW